MGKQKHNRFPHSNVQKDRLYNSRRPNQNGNSPTNYVTDIFELTDMFSEADILGSYTGLPTDGRERPIQDADDL